MKATILTSRQFNQDQGLAKRAAESGPVIITDRGKPAYVLLTAEYFDLLRANAPKITDLLAMPGAEDDDFDIPVSREQPRPVDRG